jgi:hypothetical protein
MACCGSRRQQLGSLQWRLAARSQPAAGWGAGPTRALPLAPQLGPSPDGAPGDGPVAFRYLGQAALALRSPLTGRLYRLEPGPPFWVERQDGDLLLATGLCRPA